MSHVSIKKLDFKHVFDTKETINCKISNLKNLSHLLLYFDSS